MSQRHFDLQSKQAPLREKRKRQARRLAVRAGIIALLVLAAAITASQLNALKVTDLSFDGNQVTHSRELEKVAREELTGNYALVFSRANAFIYPKRQIRERIMEDIERISSVDPRSLVIRVTERQASYLWCGWDGAAITSEDVEHDCYFVDEAGYIFSKAPFFSGPVYFRLYGATAPFEGDPVGRHVASAGDFDRLLSFKEALEELDFVPMALVLEENGEYAMLLQPESWKGSIPRILFKADSDPAAISGDLETALASDPLKDDIRDKYGSLEYIDLRFENRVFYKFR